MIHISLPAGTPTWIAILALVGGVLLGLALALVRLVRAVLPDTPAERLSWWKAFWKYRRDLRQDRWRRRQEQQARTQYSRPNHAISTNPRHQKPEMRQP